MAVSLKHLRRAHDGENHHLYEEAEDDYLGSRGGAYRVLSHRENLRKPTRMLRFMDESR